MGSGRQEEDIIEINEYSIDDPQEGIKMEDGDSQDRSEEILELLDLLLNADDETTKKEHPQD